MFYYYKDGSYVGCGNDDVMVGCVVSSEPPPAPPVITPPIIVSPRQIRQALTQLNLRTQVEAIVASGDQDTKDWWEFATSVEQNHPMVLAMATALGVTDEQRQVLFDLAASK
ncbi:MAG: hypothetical protein ACRCWC_02925 [Plesiomonas shigelloides]